MPILSIGLRDLRSKGRKSKKMRGSKGLDDHYFPVPQICVVSNPDYRPVSVLLQEHQSNIAGPVGPQCAEMVFLEGLNSRAVCRMARRRIGAERRLQSLGSTIPCCF